MFLVRHKTSGEAFLCDSVSVKRGWVTMTNPSVFSRVEGDFAYTSPIVGKLSLKSDRTIVSELGYTEELDETKERAIVKYTPPVPPKKWWQFWR